jgi:gamma-glutamyltranspeptidase/glutathione hydrolase
MKAASQNNTFLVDDPVWAEDFAPNGSMQATTALNMADWNSGTLLQLGDTITRKRYAE